VKDRSEFYFQQIVGAVNICATETVSPVWRRNA